MASEEYSVHDFLREVIPFRFLSPAQARRLSDAAAVKDYAPDAELAGPQSNQHQVCLVLAGRLTMETGAAPGQTAHLGPGQFFGERETVLEGCPVPSVRSISSCRVAHVPGESFLSLLDGNSSFAQSLAAGFRDRQGLFHAFDRFRAELMRGVAMGHFEIGDILEHYQHLEPALHPHAHDGETIDFGGLLYAVRRLPANISRTFALLLRDELPEVFDEPGEYLRDIPTMARRRSVWEVLPGKDMVLLRSGLSDLTDLISCLCLYAVEARKLRRRIYAGRSFTVMKNWLADGGNYVSPGVESLQVAKTLLDSMGFSAGETDELAAIWPGKTIQRLQEIGLHREMFSIDVRRHRNRHNSRTAELWTSQIADAVRALIGADPADFDPDFQVHIVSSNTHSVPNCLNPWYGENREVLLTWAQDRGHSACQFHWNNSMDMVYAVARDYFAANPSAISEVKSREADRGIVAVPKTLATGIEVQIIDMKKAFAEGIDERIDERISAERSPARGIIVNIDYAFGQQAETVLRSLLLLFHRNVKSVNFLGKAGALRGSRGDVLAPTCFIQQLGDEVQEIIPVHTGSLERMRVLMGSGRVHSGPMVTVEGTLLQNRIMLHYYRRLWGAVGIEMEGAYYHHQLCEGKRTGIIPEHIEQRYFYYVSDLPLGNAHNLSVPMAAAEGVPPLYAITAEVLRGIAGGSAEDIG